MKDFFPELDQMGPTRQLKEECKNIREEILSIWDDLHQDYPEIYSSIQTRHATHHVLIKELRHIHSQADAGVLMEREREEMRAVIDRSLYHVENYRAKFQVADNTEVIRREASPCHALRYSLSYMCTEMHCWLTSGLEVASLLEFAACFTPDSPFPVQSADCKPG